MFLSGLHQLDQFNGFKSFPINGLKYNPVHTYIINQSFSICCPILKIFFNFFNLMIFRAFKDFFGQSPR